MSRFWCRTLALVTVAIVFSVLFVNAAEEETIFIESSGFESLSSVQKTPLGWHKTIMPKIREYVDFIWDDEISREGSMSVSIRISEDHPKDLVAYNWNTTLKNWEPGVAYELSCWVRGQELIEPVWVCVQCWDKEMAKMLKFATTQVDYPITGTFDWQKIGVVFTIPEKTQKVVVRAGIAAPGNNGAQAWFDELHIRTTGSSKEGEPMSQAEQDRRIDYIEFLTTDIAKIRTFYSEVFGWEFTDYGPDYSSFTDGRIAGGFSVAPEVSTGGPLIVLYSTGLEEIEARIVENGGRIVRAIFEFPGGRRFHFTDPDGNELAVWSDR